MSRLIHESLVDFARRTASDSFYPGGGCVSALAGALGASLGQMVLRLTVGKKKYAEHDETLRPVLADFERLAAALTDAVDQDAEGCEAMLAAMALPKETDADKARRRQAMAAATRQACVAPEAVCRHAVSALRHFAGHVTRVNQNALSDWAVGAHQAFAALEGAALNVAINLGGIDDPPWVASMRGQLREWLAQGHQDWDSVRRQVFGQLLPA